MTGTLPHLTHCINLDVGDSLGQSRGRERGDGGIKAGHDLPHADVIKPAGGVFGGVIGGIAIEGRIRDHHCGKAGVPVI